MSNSDPFEFHLQAYPQKLGFRFFDILYVKSTKFYFFFLELFWGFYRKINKVMFYGKVVWDPFLIVAQIVCLQCLYYLTLGVFLALLVGTRVSKMSLVYFFDYAIVTASTVTGWCVIASIFLSCVAG